MLNCGNHKITQPNPLYNLHMNISLGFDRDSRQLYNRNQIRASLSKIISTGMLEAVLGHTKQFKVLNAVTTIYKAHVSRYLVLATL